jgi:hypothetical protein
MTEQERRTWNEDNRIAVENKIIEQRTNAIHWAISIAIFFYLLSQTITYAVSQAGGPCR